MSITDFIGFFAASLTTISFMPQVLKVLKTKDTAALSLPMYIIFTVGVSGWLVYGLLKGDMAVIIANAITLILTLFILYYMVSNRFNDKKVDKNNG
jgi:MtN3 and saliva related transmembrane protein